MAGVTATDDREVLGVSMSATARTGRLDRVLPVAADPGPDRHVPLGDPCATAPAEAVDRLIRVAAGSLLARCFTLATGCASGDDDRS